MINGFQRIPLPWESIYCCRHVATSTGWNLKITWTKAQDYKTSRNASKHWNKYRNDDKKFEQIPEVIALQNAPKLAAASSPASLKIFSKICGTF